jgi:hypothetical protein
VPKPRVNLTRFHGVFAPNSRDRAAVTPAKRGKVAKPHAAEQGPEKTPAQRRAAMSWALRLKRVSHPTHTTGADPNRRGTAVLGVTVGIRPKSPYPAHHFPAREARIPADIASHAG